MARGKTSGSDHRVGTALATLRAPGTEVADVVRMVREGKLSRKEYQAIASDKRWGKEYQVRLELASQAHTPQHITIEILRGLYIHDLGRLTKNVRIPAALRQRALTFLENRLRVMAPGDRTSLARTGPSHIARLLLEDAELNVVKAALLNNQLREVDLYPTLNKRKTKPEVLAAVAQSKRWLSRYKVRLLLARHPATPPRVTYLVLRRMMNQDLVELHENAALDPLVRQRALKELEKRVLGLEPEERMQLARYGEGYHLDVLAREGDEGELAALLRNENVRLVHLLQIMRKTGNKELKQAVKRHKLYKKSFSKQEKSR